MSTECFLPRSATRRGSSPPPRLPMLDGPTSAVSGNTEVKQKKQEEGSLAGRDEVKLLFWSDGLTFRVGNSAGRTKKLQKLGSGFGRLQDTVPINIQISIMFLHLCDEILETEIKNYHLQWNLTKMCQTQILKTTKRCKAQWRDPRQAQRWSCSWAPGSNIHFCTNWQSYLKVNWRWQRARGRPDSFERSEQSRSSRFRCRDEVSGGGAAGATGVCEGRACEELSRGELGSWGRVPDDWTSTCCVWTLTHTRRRCGPQTCT